MSSHKKDNMKSNAELQAEINGWRSEYNQLKDRVRQIAEKDAEIERLKVQHEEMLLKHAREQGIALSTLETALKQIALHKALLTRAADALEQFDLAKAHLGECPVCRLVAELRKAASGGNPA